MQKVRIELVLCCPVAISWNYPKTDTFLLSNSPSTANATMCTTLMANLFPFYHQCLAFAHEIRIICSIYYGASYSNWTGFSVLRAPIFFGNLFKESERICVIAVVAVVAVVVVLWHFTRILCSTIRLGYLFMGWRFAVYDSPLAIFTLPFLCIFFYIYKFAIAIARFMCSLNWKCSTMALDNNAITQN